MVRMVARVLLIAKAGVCQKPLGPTTRWSVDGLGVADAIRALSVYVNFYICTRILIWYNLHMNPVRNSGDSILPKPDKLNNLKLES